MEVTVLYNILKNQIDCSLEQVTKYFNQIDQEDILNTEMKRYRYEIWDKESPINGVSAKDILASRNYEINQVYLIYIDTKLVYFQDHNPNEQGFVKMNKNNVKKIAEDFINRMAEHNVNSYIINIVLEKIKNEGAEN